MNDKIDSSLLAIARQQVFDEYIKARANDLTEWLLECDKAWKQDKTMLPYPSFPYYPNDEDIIARAKMISESLNKTSEEVIEEDEPEEIVEKIEEPEVQNTPRVFYKKKKKWKK